MKDIHITSGAVPYSYFVPYNFTIEFTASCATAL